MIVPVSSLFAVAVRRTVILLAFFLLKLDLKVFNESQLFNLLHKGFPIFRVHIEIFERCQSSRTLLYPGIPVSPTWLDCNRENVPLWC